ncbi:MAG: hypothetical protein Q6373_015320 [Candidatus Sigynarchaeota archaeon]
MEDITRIRGRFHSNFFTPGSFCSNSFTSSGSHHSNPFTVLEDNDRTRLPILVGSFHPISIVSVQILSKMHDCLEIVLDHSRFHDEVEQAHVVTDDLFSVRDFLSGEIIDGKKRSFSTNLVLGSQMI